MRIAHNGSYDAAATNTSQELRSLPARDISKMEFTRMAAPNDLRTLSEKFRDNIFHFHSFSPPYICIRVSLGKNFVAFFKSQ